MTSTEIASLKYMLQTESETVIDLALNIVENIPNLNEGGMPLDVLNMLAEIRSELLIEYHKHLEGKVPWPKWRRALVTDLAQLIIRGYKWQ